MNICEITKGKGKRESERERERMANFTLPNLIRAITETTTFYKGAKLTVHLMVTRKATCIGFDAE